jgi:hypothetical protein
VKVIALALAFIVLSLASANATHRYHHHWRHYSSMGARYNPNGTAGGPTTLSWDRVISIRRIVARYHW